MCLCTPLDCLIAMKCQQNLAIAALFFIVLGVFAHSSHVEPYTGPTLASDMTINGLLYEAGTHDHFNYHRHILVHSHNDYVEHHHDIEHFDHVMGPTESIDFSGFDDNAGAHQGVAERSASASDPNDTPLYRHSHEREHRHGGSHTHTAHHRHLFGLETHAHSWDGHSEMPSSAADLTLAPELRLVPNPHSPDEVHNNLNTDGGSSDSGSSGSGSSDLPEDVDGDGDVDNDDLSAVAMNFGGTPTGDFARYDVDGDGDIDTDDFAQVQSQLGSTVNSAPAASLALQLERIKALNIADPDFQHVIQLLERHLPEPAPKKTVLLANYPNPFNPETWIPYRLAKPADVMLTIYATNGQPVRSLALGHQPAGNYVNRARAAYWDGKNAFGESVASGI